MDTNFNSIANYNFQPSSETAGGGSSTTLNFNASLDANCKSAALEISDWLDDIGFSAEHPMDPSLFHSKLSEIIKRNIEGNVNYAR